MFDQCKLPNGLTIVGERLPYFRSVSAGVWLMAGSQYESREENGLSHFLEHMIFKGTQLRTARQIAEEMDAVGGQLNAFTAKDCTCVYAKVVDENLELALDVLSDMVRNSTFDAGELEKEKGVVLEEIAMTEDEPEDLVSELSMDAHFGDQPLAWPILGPADNVRGFTSDTLRAYRDRMYRPECTVLAVAGNYDWDKLLELCNRFFGSWQPTGQAQPSFQVLPSSPRILRREKDIEQLHITLSYPGFGQNTDEVYPVSILSNILGGAMSSRLFQKIREESGMAYSVYSYPLFYTGTGLLGIYAGTSPQHAPAVVRLIRQEIDKLAAEGVTQKEFEQTRAQLKSSYVLGQESASARMNALGRRMLLMGDIQTEDDVLRKLNAIQFEEVNRVLREIFEKPCAVALVGQGANSLDLSPFEAK